VNSDTVIRKTFYKYLHPKEAYVGNGVLNSELVRYKFIKYKDFLFLELHKESLKSRTTKAVQGSSLKGTRTQKMNSRIEMKTEV